MSKWILCCVVVCVCMFFFTHRTMWFYRTQEPSCDSGTRDHCTQAVNKIYAHGLLTNGCTIYFFYSSYCHHAVPLHTKEYAYASDAMFNANLFDCYKCCCIKIKWNEIRAQIFNKFYIQWQLKLTTQYINQGCYEKNGNGFHMK